MDHREQVWLISPDPSGDGFLIASFEHESELFGLGRKGRTSRGWRLELSGLLHRSEDKALRWTRRRIPIDEAKSIGSRLWSALPPWLQEPLQNQPPDAPPLHLKVATEISAVADLPWEWLFDGIEPPLALRPGIRLLRSVPARFPIPSVSVTLPLRVLLLVPNSKDERLINASAEISTMLAQLSPPDYVVSVLDEPSLDAVARELREWRPHVVHYIGHGGLSNGEGCLILPDAGGTSRWVGASELSGLLPSSVRLLCLSTPFTTQNYQILGLSHLSMARGLLELPTAVANQFPVGPEPVGSFWQVFYAALTEHGNVIEAVHGARVAAAAVAPGFADWASFSLTVRGQTGVPFGIGHRGVDPIRRQAELTAHFAAQLANDLAVQVEDLGDQSNGGLQEQYAVEQSRAAGLLDELSSEV